MLGQFQVLVDVTAVPASTWRSARAMEAVKALALALGYQLHREQLLDVLCPELTTDVDGGSR